MDSLSISKAITSATPNVAELLDRHARWSAQMCRNLPSLDRQMCQNVPSTDGPSPTSPPKCAGTCQNMPECAICTKRAKTNQFPGTTMDELSYRQLTAARLIVRGRGSVEVANHLGVNRHTVAIWKRNPAFRAEVERLRERLTASAVTPRPRARKVAPPSVPRAHPAAPRAIPSRANPLGLTKEDLEHEAMIQAYMRAHGM
jgi:hypothetical protein